MSEGLVEAARISSEVRAVASLELPVLRRLWRERWAEEAPKFRSRDLLSRAFTYRLQAERLGELSSRTKRLAADYALRFAADRTFTPTAGPNLKPGSSLVREWRGARHEVAVTQDGFSYRGEAYASLSKVAHAITGTKWNGLVFFGLKSRGGRGR